MLLLPATPCLVTSVAAGLLIVLIYVIANRLLRCRQVPDISSKYVLITGCDSGFGELACKRLDSLGCNVIAACLTEDGANRMQSEGSRRLHAIRIDVTDEGSIQEAVESVSKILPEGKGLWGLVNNAGISGELGPVEWLDRTNVEKLFQVNVIGMVSVVRAFLPLMKKSSADDGGRIVNVSSIVGQISLPYASSYCMSKHAIEAFSDALRVEVYEHNISVSIIEPGGHKTPFLDNLSNSIHASWNKLPEAKKQEFGETFLRQVLFLGAEMMPYFGSTDLNPVADAFCHALFSVWPRRRYFIGLDAFLLRLLSFLPSFVTDFVFLCAIRLSSMICHSVI